MLKHTLSTSLILIAIISFSQSTTPYDWIAGTWVGDGFGGTSEEVWSLPDKSGVMMGSYRHFDADGNINFYEYFLLDSSGLVLKHFDKDFIGWEEKDKFISFKMKEITSQKVIMEGLVYEYVSDSVMKVHLDMKTREGIKTEVFTMERK